MIKVVAGIVFRSGKLLISRRPFGKHLGGLWEFPGGKLEPHESPEAGLSRELQEELRISPVVGTLFFQIHHDYPEKSVHLSFYLCRLLDGAPESQEGNDYKWVTNDELGAFDFPEADFQLIEKLQSLDFKDLENSI